MRQAIGALLVFSGACLVESDYTVIPALLICVGALLALTKKAPIRWRA